MNEQPHAQRRGRLLNGNPSGDYAAAPRCGAKTRAGTACRAPAVHGRKRCRMHGGAKRSGAQPGNRNARKHGLRSAAHREGMRKVRELIRHLDELIRQGWEL
jgi:hypothetical protein